MTAMTLPRQGRAIAAGHGFRTAPYAVCTRHAGMTVLLDARRGLYYTLNELGWRIWDQLDAGAPVAAIIRTLCQEYCIPVSSFESDAVAFIERLLDAELIDAAAG